MINQLGNLHEAGQQLAEARERAARAETEAVFLRERLVEMRQQQEAEAATVPIQEPVTAEPQRMEPQPQTLQEPASSEPPEIEPAWLYLYRRWENRSRKRKR
jgi:cell division septation protein DedD